MSCATPPTKRTKKEKPSSTAPRLSSESEGDSPYTKREKQEEIKGEDTSSGIVQLSSKPVPTYTNLYVRYCVDGVWKRELFDFTRVFLATKNKTMKNSTSVIENIEVTYMLLSGKKVPVVFQTPEMFVYYCSFEKVWKEGNRPETTFGLSYEFRNYEEFAQVMKAVPCDEEPDGIKFYRDLQKFEDRLVDLIAENRETLLPGLEIEEDEEPKKAISRVFDRLTKKGKRKEDNRYVPMPPVLKLKIDKFEDSDYKIESFLRIDSPDGAVRCIPTHVTTIRPRSKIIAMFTYDTLMLMTGKVIPKRRMKQVTQTAAPNTTVAPMNCEE